ncbi:MULTISPECIES: TonB-dependent receptor [unclassified Stenotrophomonas]|uniref:TonB-dependent receptor n=1 Tax=unclassified Stenotrophomonas TaxID=196198 RepID=UPI000D1679EF|nr:MULTISPECIES: TonB-dependent receptor [unclassified Stenotrophomonas]PTA73005.1 heme-binding protein [Stenotrophomonas sp. Nf1]PTA78934.1 heme-binding protein [Stenotrophomonas sp. Nf4]
MKLPCPSPRPLAIALYLALASPCLLPATAVAQNTAATVRWQIPAGPLDQALTAFGQQSGLPIAADARLTRGRHSQGVHATLGTDAALAQLLAGTGLTFQRDASGVVLRAAPAADAGVRQIGTLRVAGQASEGASPWGLADADAVYRDSGSRVHLDRQQLERFRGQSIGDVLAGAVGVHTADVRNGGALDVNIRGLQGQNRVPVIIDGGQQAIDVYRGYAGVQQRSYLDPDLISSVSIEKGPSLAANAASAIGGVVYMETLNVDDILDDGQAWGLRVRGGVADNSIDRTRVFQQVARGSDNRNSLRDPRDWNGSVAFAQRGEDWQLVAAYARRRQGNYFAGRNDAERYDEQHLSSGGTGMSGQAVSTIYHPGDEVLNTHTDNESALLKFTWTPSPDQRVELSHRYFNSSFGEIMPSAIGRVPESNEWVTYVDPANTMAQFEPGQMRVNATSLRQRYRPETHPWLDLSSTLWFTTATSRMFNSNLVNTPLFKNYPGDAMPDTLGETYAPGLQSDVKTRRWGVDSSNTTRFSNRLGDWTLRYGAAFQHEDTAPNSPVLPVDYNKNRYLRSGTRREASAVASLQWQPWDWLSLTAGGRFIDYRTRDRNRVAFVSESRDLRYTFARLSKGGQLLPGWYKEWYPDAQGNYTYDSLRATPYGESTLGQSYDFDGFIADPRGANAFYTKQIPTAWGYKPAIRRSGHGFAPYAEARFNLDSDMFFYVKYAQGWKMPSLFESTLGNSTSAPVADLKPEKNRSWDIGFSLLKQDLWRDGDRLAFKVAWFKNDIDNAITRRFDSSNWAFYVDNVDNYTVSGYELQSGYDAGIAYLDLSASYYQRARTCDAATAAAMRARHSRWNNLGGTPDCVDGGFGTSFVNAQNPPKYSIHSTLGLRLFDRRLDTGIRRTYNSGPTHELDKPWNITGSTGLQNIYLPTAIYDVYARWQFTPKAEVELVVSNLRNTYYMDTLAMSLMPGPGRTTRLNFTARF